MSRRFRVPVPAGGALAHVFGADPWRDALPCETGLMAVV